MKIFLSGKYKDGLVSEKYISREEVDNISEVDIKIPILGDDVTNEIRIVTIEGGKKLRLCLPINVQVTQSLSYDGENVSSYYLDISAK